MSEVYRICPKCQKEIRIDDLPLDDFGYRIHMCGDIPPFLINIKSALSENNNE